jgi:hypothetical protein
LGMGDLEVEKERLQEGNGVKEVATRVVESGKNWVGICT